MKKLLLIILGLSLPSVSFAHGSYFKYGVGIGDTQYKKWNDVKFFGIGYQEQLISVLDHQIELGMWGDTNGMTDRKSSGIISWSPGISVIKQNYYAKGFWGVALISTTDSMLGGHFMFNQDLEFGLKDKRGVAIGLVYKHVSSAGIYNPNIGRDFLTVKLQVPL